MNNETPSPSHGIEPYHVGILVSDMATGIETMSRRLGVTFWDPVEMRPHELEDRINHTRAPGRVLVTYSKQGPFRYELIEFVGDGLYSPRQGEGLHHLGVWEPEPEQRLAELERDGAAVDAVFRSPDGRVSAIYAAPIVGNGLRVEYVSEAERPRLERWFATGALKERTP